jgi:hypothetical protein
MPAPLGNKYRSLPPEDRKASLLFARVTRDQKATYVRACAAKSARKGQKPPKLAAWVTETLDREAKRELKHKPSQKPAEIPLATEEGIYDD